ncbi:hypothetical protein K504DRAFT_436333 [Pleomassaria siparia CBS 279.74]|uniref:Rhodopsin domain-containing protein n=1 Tax=Pleomassaria siparia CBS 279.74 TaxID=1314801 RepID=A0A6G1K2K3_9PLEO|nr:hypothetical protein K504DRAFT_436333 [Pleomassaria siparia CBS 279.74]
MATEQLLANPPDANEPQPLYNRRETIMGATIPFLIISYMAVLFRVYVRIKIIRDPGWDDFFVVLAAVRLLLPIEYGLGRHMLYTPDATMVKYQMLFYVENAMYITEGGFIKVSLLFQYLRIFKAGVMRYVCLTLLVVISLWAVSYSAIAWVPCMPIREYWERYGSSKCWGLGFNDEDSFVRTIESHSALNMVFDALVFMIPLVLFSESNLRLKNILAMVGVFTVGILVVFISVWRLYTIVDHRAATYPYMDFTWWAPLTLILSCLEINLAIICASMPIFWPILEQSLAEIFVTSEVRISSENRALEDAGRGFELRERAESIKSTSGNSRESLTREPARETVDAYAHYKDQYVIAQVDPFGNNVPGARVETEIATKPKPKWAI